MDDPVIKIYSAEDVEVAAEFLTHWLPFLTNGLCDGCSLALRDRVRSLNPVPAAAPTAGDASESDPAGFDDNTNPLGLDHIEPSGWDTDPAEAEPLPSPEPSGWGTDPPSPEPLPSPSPSPEPSGMGTTPPSPAALKIRVSWADMAQEDELEEEEEEVRRKATTSREEVKKKQELSRDQREQIRFRNVRRKKDFICLERVNGKLLNILDGLELHTAVFSAAEQKRIVDFVYQLQEMGKKNQLREHTYSQPRKWMRGKGRVTIQFGCCYNYAEKNGVPPGIMRDGDADPLPDLFKVIIRRLVRWHVLSESCVPDSCIVNIYEPEDCIPPHIDSHDFVRPFTTVSFLSECSILFGTNLRVAGPGEFTGSTSISLPVGSVLVLNGNGADVAQHCVPAVPNKRISITFRKMQASKRPMGFTSEPDLQNIVALPVDPGSNRIQTPDDEVAVVESQGRRNSNRRHNKGKGSPGSSNQRLEMRGRRIAHNEQSAVDSRSLEPFRMPQDDDKSDGSTRRLAAGEGRRVHLQQKRIVVSLDVEGEDESTTFGRRPTDGGRHRNEGEDEQQNVGGRRDDDLSRVRLQSLNHSRRRVRVSLYDG